MTAVSRRRVLLLALLVAVVLVPAVSRVYQRLSDGPSREAPRFRWATSCDTVPQKAASIAIVTAVAGRLDPPSEHSWEPPVTVTPAPVRGIQSVPGLRAPPSGPLHLI